MVVTFCRERKTVIVSELSIFWWGVGMWVSGCVALWEEALSNSIRGTTREREGGRERERQRQRQRRKRRRVVRLCFVVVARVIAVRSRVSFLFPILPRRPRILRSTGFHCRWVHRGVRSGQVRLTWPLLGPTMMPDFSVASFAIVSKRRWVILSELVSSMGGMGRGFLSRLRFCTTPKPAGAKVRPAKPCAVCVWCTVGPKGESRSRESWHNRW